MNVLIKPASGLCNMRCKYCFYADEMARRETESYGIMSLPILEAVVKNAIEYSRRDRSVSFMFQGGEPTLAGLGFFREFVKFVKKHNVFGLRVELFLQTNGYVIDSEWADFFAENDFLIGLSVDGTKDVHDINRINANGDGTHKKVMQTVELFKKRKVRFNAVCVVTEKTARYVVSIYNFFKKQGLLWQQYIPCLDPFDSRECEFLSAEAYGDFLCKLFDLWHRDVSNGRYVYNRTFENYMGILLGKCPEECGMRGECSVQFVIESDGSVFPCDFYALDEYRLGNFATDTYEDIVSKAADIRFVERSRNINEKCKSCRWFSLCLGGCKRYCEPICGNTPSVNRFCASYQKFFEYSYERLEALSKAVKAGIL